MTMVNKSITMTMMTPWTFLAPDDDDDGEFHVVGVWGPNIWGLGSHASPRSCRRLCVAFARWRCIPRRAHTSRRVTALVASPHLQSVCSFSGASTMACACFPITEASVLVTDAKLRKLIRWITKTMRNVDWTDIIKVVKTYKVGKRQVHQVRILDP